MKNVGGILGILGGLLGGADVIPYLAAHGSILGIAGSACAVSCFCLGIAVLLTGGRVAGLLMILPAIAGTILAFGLMTPAILGAGLASYHGRYSSTVEDPEAVSLRLEREVQQRYGSGN
jgi:hypothetical protein